MKKLLILLTAIIIGCSAFFTACTETPSEMTNQEISSVYQDVVMQTLSKLGINAPPQIGGGAKPLRFSIPNKKTETTDEHAIQNIKYISKDTAGIMYLLSLLYKNPNFYTVNGIARFDATYEIYGSSVTQNINIRSTIEKEENKLYFESMVFTPEYNASGYSFVDITYNYETSTLIDCRFVSKSANEYVDMMLTEDSKYLYYKTNTADEFTSAVDNMHASFTIDYEQVGTLTTNFSAEMMEYMAFSGYLSSQVQSPSQGGGNTGDNGGENGGEQEQTKPIVPEQGGTNNPTNEEVNLQTWNEYLNLVSQQKFSVLITNGTGRMINYKVDGDKIEVTEDNGGIPTITYYSIESGAYYRYDIIKGPTDMQTIKTPITEQEYNLIKDKARINYSLIFNQEDFQYVEENSYYACVKNLGFDIENLTVWFSSGKLTHISFYKEELPYTLTFSFENISVSLPTIN